MTRAEQAVRDLAICEAYKAGSTLAQLALAHGVSATCISAVLKRKGCSPTPAEVRERINTGLRARWQEPEFRERQSAAFVGRVKKLWRKDAGFRERLAAASKAACSVWPDCPDHLLEDYDTLRHYHGAREARRQLDPGFTAP